MIVDKGMDSGKKSVACFQTVITLARLRIFVVNTPIRITCWSTPGCRDKMSNGCSLKGALNIMTFALDGDMRVFSQRKGLTSSNWMKKALEAQTQTKKQGDQENTPQPMGRLVNAPREVKP